ncbi:MAG: hypothetical protein SAJ12_08160 [Jaaginema sp. PMC 1079.18]|nr:hypothetical protein [Jaaginema sp. PMC 1080.18]MEC4850972.1 hypothetical protein [Jaaginema sp. PMC 1079.18]MEC4865825.1 hypothetical protein [Jaaginema sp. PMC 1078.18]
MKNKAALIVETSNREQLQTLRDDFGEELTVAAWGLASGIGSLNA